MVNRSFSYEDQYRQLKKKTAELKNLAESMQIDLSGEIVNLERKMEHLRRQRYDHLEAWEKVIISRHPSRPSPRECMDRLCDEWLELHGDRLYGDDRAVVAGIGLFHGQAVTLFGFQKGRETPDKIKCNFGMPQPEGYRKVLRLALQAEKFGRPILTFIDTPGAFPGVSAEERGQAWAIAETILAMCRVTVPVISVVTGEGGSGGALALGVADRLIMLSNSVFSVASPEACASILWKDLSRTEEMAEALKITAQDLLALGIVDEIIPEPPGGVQQDPESCLHCLDACLQKHLDELCKLDSSTLPDRRYHRLRAYAWNAVS